ncbi:MAG: site-specific integrase [Clostridia bacterium]|nr:site-specific integrase [Clostridia bacterium]
MPKRANNEGSIRRRPDGRWEARYTLGRDPGTGKQVQKSIYGDTQKEVRQRLQQVATAIDEGIFVQPSKMTVGQWLDIWQKEYLGGVKPATVVSYGQQVKNHIMPALGAVKLSALHAAPIQKLYNDLQIEGLSPKTIKNVHGVLHRALKQAVILGYIRANPSDACTLPRIEKIAIQPLDSPDIEAFLNALRGAPMASLFTVDVFTGMRLGEILGLQWPCVDFTRGTILIDKQLLRPRQKGDNFRFGPLKNDKPRVVTPAPFVMQALRERRREQMEQKLRAGCAWNESVFPDLVFTNAVGKHLNYNIVQRHFKQALKRAGIPEKRFHDLRHTYAVSSLRAGDDVKTVQENLGHHTAAFTLDQYGHVTESMRRDSAARMEAFIRGLKTGR